MSQFINLTDYDASIHREILDALTREDDTIVEICEDRAIAEMRCYLSKRYDCDRIFSAEGDKRNQLVLMMLLDMAIYHIFCIHNPQKLSQLRKDRYERAVEWMKAVSAEEVSVDGAPLLPDDELARRSQFQIKSNTKRVNHY
jgi:phage gp36-like protein